MENVEYLKSKIKKIEKQITNLKNKQQNICNEIRNNKNLPFFFKFKIWLTCSEKNHAHINSDSFPNTVKFLNKNGYKNGQYIDIFKEYEDKFLNFMEDTIDENEKELIENTMIELFNANIKILTF